MSGIMLRISVPKSDIYVQKWCFKPWLDISLVFTPPLMEWSLPKWSWQSREGEPSLLDTVSSPVATLESPVNINFFCSWCVTLALYLLTDLRLHSISLSPAVVDMWLQSLLMCQGFNIQRTSGTSHILTDNFPPHPPRHCSQLWMRTNFVIDDWRKDIINRYISYHAFCWIPWNLHHFHLLLKGLQ